MTKASANIFPKLIGSEGAAPSTPASATAILYVKADGLWYSKDDAGVETLVSGGSGGLATIQFVIDGGGATITTGIKGFVEVPFACTVTAARMFADQSGSIVVDIWKDTYANYPPVDADSITASAPPTISSATKSQDTTLTGWTTAIAAGSIFGFNVDSATTVQRVTVALTVTRT